ncbi:MAG TPA: 4-carboxy-4-hydroxy-2-oxoadipate aldolase/oxaloacetate decarboxylase [Alphaproteobacteria bacterium]|nr:4-carboxy-4-hydroxy-2-oxoadipate aldolase/oxaloacetate decarboxylase [Alphaproteobacteria bacterium]
MTSPIIYTKIPGTDPGLVAAAAEAGVADLHEALGALSGMTQLMGPRMRPLDMRARIAGPAVTVMTWPSDNLMMHKALDMAEAGQVLVITNGGSARGALWGELAAVAAQRKRIAGVVTDAAVRDTSALLAMGFPVWSTAIHASHGEKRGPGAVNVPIVIDGVVVNPGDIIVADSDGVLAVPRQSLADAVKGAQQRRAKEAGMKERLAAGGSLLELLGLDKVVAATGIAIRETSWEEDQKGGR